MECGWIEFRKYGWNRIYPKKRISRSNCTAIYNNWTHFVPFATNEAALRKCLYLHIISRFKHFNPIDPYLIEVFRHCAFSLYRFKLLVIKKQIFKIFVSFSIRFGWNSGENKTFSNHIAFVHRRRPHNASLTYQSYHAAPSYLAVLWVYDEVRVFLLVNPSRLNFW